MMKSNTHRLRPSLHPFLTFTIVAASFARADEPTVDDGCATFGTCINWTDDFASARQQADEQSKLLFVMHLSGNFTKETFT